MAEIKFTKNELRDQQVKLSQLQRYLPTLQLKKAMLQAQAVEVRAEIVRLEREAREKREIVDHFSSLLLENLGMEPRDLARVTRILKTYENVAGVEIPTFEGISFSVLSYNLFESPIWLDTAVKELRALVECEVRTKIAIEKKMAIEKELREVSIRVNLFEKVMIPKALDNIKMIRVFLGDQQLASVARAKVAKAKIEEKKVMKGVEL